MGQVAISQAGRLMETALAALKLELADSGDDGLCAKAIYPGVAVPSDYAANDECEGGMAWVRLISAAPTMAFPAQDMTADSCAATLAYSVEMGIIRPAPIPESFQKDMDLPDDEEHIEAAHRQFNDMHLMHRALKRIRRSVDQMVFGSYTPVGPEGGVVGGSWDFTFGEDDD
jgi:hypothetical protein